jgi:hypothetical protein
MDTFRVARASQLLAYLASLAFRDIAGSRVSARIPVSRALLNRVVADALQGTTTPVRSVDIRPRAGDEFEVLIAVSWPFIPPLKVTLVVERQPQFPASPVLVLRWSFLGAMGAIVSRLVASFDRLPAGVRLDGNRVVLDIPTLAGPDGAMLLPALKSLEIHTLDDRAVFDIELEIV